jgi:hypothetical protein
MMSHFSTQKEQQGNATTRSFFLNVPNIESALDFLTFCFLTETVRTARS